MAVIRNFVFYFFKVRSLDYCAQTWVCVAGLLVQSLDLFLGRNQAVEFFADNSVHTCSIINSVVLALLRPNDDS